MDSDKFISKIADFIGGLLKSKSGTDLSGLKLPDTVTPAEFGEIIGLVKGFLASSEIRTVAVETRNHISAAVVDAEKAGASAGWSKLKAIITDERMKPLIQPLITYALSNQDKFAAALKIFTERD